MSRLSLLGIHTEMKANFANIVESLNLMRNDHNDLAEDGEKEVLRDIASLSKRNPFAARIHFSRNSHTTVRDKSCTS